MSISNDFLSLLLQGLSETAYMTALSTLFALLVGLPLGIILVITDKDHIQQSPIVNKVLGTIVNAGRSFPSIILIVVLLPLSRLIVGTTLGSTAAVVPLSIGSAPFVARIIESSLKQVERGKIEAAQAMGAGNLKIIFDVMMPEALPSLIRGTTISIITIISFTAMAGAIGGGGLGSLAIRFGYERFRDDIMAGTIVTLVVLVQLIQWSGDLAVYLINRKRHKFD